MAATSGSATLPDRPEVAASPGAPRENTRAPRDNAGLPEVRPTPCSIKIFEAGLGDHCIMVFGAELLNAHLREILDSDGVPAAAAAPPPPPPARAE